MMGATRKLMDEAAAKFVARERSWLPHDRRGRWVVLEAGVGRHLKGSPRDVRQFADRVTPRRARRFSSLSRARKFARQVGGTVYRWRRRPPSGGTWQSQSPWQRATEVTWGALHLPGLIFGPREGAGEKK